MLFAVIGSSGMFGKQMLNYLGEVGAESRGFTRAEINLDADVGSLARTMGGSDVIINAAAITGVERAESDPEETYRVNGEYAGKLAQAASMLGAKFVQISTNYVFSSDSISPISADSQPNPVNVYGSSKALGETLVMDSGADYLIARTAWLYGAYGRCFPNPISKMLREDGEVDIVMDQYGQPTWTKDLAHVIYSHATNSFSERIVNAVASGRASWFDFATAVWVSAGRPGKHSINPVSTMDFNSDVARPQNSVLENGKTIGPVIGDWLERWLTAAPEVLPSIQKSS